MKSVIRAYRLLKPAAVYTSYLFTTLSILYLLVQTVSAELLPFSAGFLWGIFFFSLGSICLQRILLGKGYPEGASYGIRLFLYLGTAGIWGAVCLYLSGTTGQEAGYAACGLILLAGLCVCCGFELFNRYRAHMYNRLLEQYKKRRHV